MQQKLLFFLFFIGTSFYSKAQLTDNFSDGNFTTNPTWTGSAADWQVNASQQLQSNNSIVNGTFFLSTASTLATTAQWEFYCNLTFNTSSTNYVDVFVTASASDVTVNSTTGYFVRIGNTNDEICLYRKDANGMSTKIIDGIDGITNTSNNVLKIKVIRSATNVWSLLRDVTGTGNNYFTEGTVADAIFTTSSFFSILIKQSTASFFQRHFFDDFIVQTFVPDITPPSIISSTATSATMVDVLFNEPVEVASSQMQTNYLVSNGVGSPITAVRDLVNPALAHLTFGTNLPIRTALTLTVNAVKDLSANTLNNGTSQFIYYVPLQYDIVIDEIMADPTPVVGLPTNEWLELKNASTFPINIQNWKLGKSTGESGNLPNYIIPAGGYVIVCTGTAVAAMSPFGPTVSVTSFPSLNNDADKIYIKAPQGLIVHAVSYTDAWYKNELKKDGGWSLEMIDTKNPCTGFTNWAASIDPRGGTAGTKNSIDAVNADVTAPKLLRAYATNATQITLVFDEPLDSTKAAINSNYTISDGIGNANTALPLSILFDRVQLTIGTALNVNTIYTVTANNVTDCAGNSIGNNKTAKVSVAANIDSFDIVVNEILFNPKPNGVDYVELYNRSKKTVNLKNAYLANRNTAGTIASITQCSTEDYLFFPGDYIVITNDAAIVKRDYLVTNPNAFLQVSNTPSFNDDAGNVIILNEQGKIIDEVNYTDKWQFALINNKEGVALERINANEPSVQSNFHSAATSVGFGTPTYKNSQSTEAVVIKGDITVSPAIVSPDNDGQDDIATITYTFTEPGYVANITIFDAVGRPIKYLQRNALCGLNGFYRWDGLGEKQQKLPVGLYVIYTEIFNLQGKTKKFKNTIVLAKK